MVTRLASKAFTKVWGSPRTEPWYANPAGEKIGEVWFDSPAGTPLLIKFLFTSESLSIQVHPDDEYAAKRHDSRGKTEMWRILRAEPGAKIAVGPAHGITQEKFEAAVGKKEILDLLNWVEVAAGDTWFIPAGTIHALGGGLALCEIQQLSDVTYRIYDFERGRELHIEDGVKVSRLTPCEGKREPVELDPGRELLAECGYFRTEKIAVSGRAESEAGRVYVALEGTGRIGRESFKPGEAFAIDGRREAIESDNAVFLSTCVPK